MSDEPLYFGLSAKELIGFKYALDVFGYDDGVLFCDDLTSGKLVNKSAERAIKYHEQQLERLRTA